MESRYLWHYFASEYLDLNEEWRSWDRYDINIFPFSVCLSKIHLLAAMELTIVYCYVASANKVHNKYQVSLPRCSWPLCWPCYLLITPHHVSASAYLQVPLLGLRNVRRVEDTAATCSAIPFLLVIRCSCPRNFAFSQYLESKLTWASSLLKASTSDSSKYNQYNQATKTGCARWCWKHNTMNTDKCVIWSFASRSSRCTLYRRCFMIRSWFRLHLVSGTPKCGEGGEFKKACLLTKVRKATASTFSDYCTLNESHSLMASRN